MIQKSHRFIIAFILSLSFFLTASVFAHDKVVVIPLMETVEALLTPYAPLAAVSPPNSAYTIGTDTVTDNITGLVWQKDDNNSQGNWNLAWTQCQVLNLSGKQDWRLPTVAELMSIVDYGAFNPAINTAAFSGTKDYYYWSATTYAIDSEDAWVISFSNGNIDIFDKPDLGYVRCVRELPVLGSDFKDNGNGTVTDLATGLTWQRQDDDTQRAWDAANTYCQNLPLGGKTDWRLPNIKELQSIVDERVSAPTIDAGAFPGSTSSLYWSATNYTSNSIDAWIADFWNGRVRFEDKLSPYFVRCVRSGQ